MSYRIVTNNLGQYKIQKKGFFFGWNDHVEMGLEWSYAPVFDSPKDAQARLEELRLRDARWVAPWVEVTTPTHPEGQP